MEIKIKNFSSSHTKFFLIFAFFALCTKTALTAAEQTFEQKIEWKSNANALEYKVEIENLTTGKIQFIKTEETSENLSLTHGKYRYRVYAYDFLGKQTSLSPWTEFEIYKASTPKINSLEKNVQIQAEDNTVSLNVDITDVNQNSKFELVSDSLTGKISSEDKIKMPLSDSETQAVTHLDFKDVPPGKWRLKITNASGLSTISDEIVIEGKKLYTQEEVLKIREEEKENGRNEAKATYDEYIKANEEKIALADKITKEHEEAKKAEHEQIQNKNEAADLEQKQREAERARIAEEERLKAEQKAAEKARLAEEKAAKKREREEWKKAHPYKWKDVIFEAGLILEGNLYDSTIKDHYDETLTFSPHFKVAYLPIKRGSNKFGVEAACNYGAELHTDNSLLTSKLSFSTFDLKFVWHYKLFRNIFVAAKGGLGLDIITREMAYHSSADRTSPNDKTYCYPLVTAESSVFFTPWKFLVFEAGLNFTHIFGGSSQMGFVQPFVCAGFRF